MKIEELITILKENFPNGCKDTRCKDCPIYHTNLGTPEDLLCNLLSNLHEDYNNFEE